MAWKHCQDEEREQKIRALKKQGVEMQELKTTSEPTSPSLVATLSFAVSGAKERELKLDKHS